MATDILVVDDEADIRDLVAGILEDEGYAVRTAPDAEAALAAVRARRPALLILDIWMQGGGMDGLELADRLRAADRTRVVVLATTVDTRALAPLARACGAAALVHKQWLTPRLLRGLWVAHRRR